MASRRLRASALAIGATSSIGQSSRIRAYKCRLGCMSVIGFGLPAANPYRAEADTARVMLRTIVSKRPEADTGIGLAVLASADRQGNDCTGKA
jgi:hypothetical protein